MKKKIVVSAMLAFFAVPAALVQDVVVKTNVLYDATCTVNLGAEFGLTPRWMLDLSSALNCVKEDVAMRYFCVFLSSPRGEADRLAGFFVRS